MLRPLEGGPGRSRAFSPGWLDEAGLHKLLCSLEKADQSDEEGEEEMEEEKEAGPRVEVQCRLVFIF